MPNPQYYDREAGDDGDDSEVVETVQVIPISMPSTNAHLADNNENGINVHLANNMPSNLSYKDKERMLAFGIAADDVQSSSLTLQWEPPSNITYKD